MSISQNLERVTRSMQYSTSPVHEKNPAYDSIYKLTLK